MRSVLTTVLFTCIALPIMVHPHAPVRAQTAEADFSFAGVIEPSRRVIVSNKVTGVISEVAAKPGSRVEAGQVLFRLDAAEFELAVAQATAARAEAAAALALADDVAGRQATLRERGTGAAAAARQSTLQADIARAALARADADLALAKLNLERTTIRAAMAGVMTAVTGVVGQFVEAEADTQLAEIVQIDPVFVRYSVPHDVRQRAMRLTGATRVEEMLNRIRFTVIEPSGAEHPHMGRAQFESTIVDPKEGTLTTWGSIPNPRRTLLPGLKVQVRSRLIPDP